MLSRSVTNLSIYTPTILWVLANPCEIAIGECAWTIPQADAGRFVQRDGGAFRSKNLVRIQEETILEAL
jgi:hypothetical protein